jgi:hypothetical protein
LNNQVHKEFKDTKELLKYLENHDDEVIRQNTKKIRRNIEKTTAEVNDLRVILEELRNMKISEKD